MKKPVQRFLLLLLGVTFVSNLAAQGQDKLLKILHEELDTQWKELQAKPQPPYYMNYRVIDATTAGVSASFGAVTGRNSSRSRTLVPQVRIGNPRLDNFKYADMGAGQSSAAQLPLDDKGAEKAIRLALWKEMESRYNFAVSMFEQTRAQAKTAVEEEDKAPYFSDAPVEKYYEAPMAAAAIDLTAWGKRMEAISAVFKSDPKLIQGDAMFMYRVERRYFIDSEGREVVQNLPYARIMVFGQTRADDGMQLPMNLSYFAYDPTNLPSNEQIIADARKMMKTLTELRDAPMASPFTGPALLSGPASGVFFHEIFGHRIEGQRMKRGSDGQTFKKMVGQNVLPADMTVYDDPTLKRYANTDLNGYYKFDDQGIRAERVDVVKDGKLNDFLMTRTPIDNHPHSNGHARATDFYDPVSRQSNLVIETKKPYTQQQMRQMLVDEIKKQGKEYGYYFVEVTSGFTMTGKNGVNSFNVTPLVVYKVFPDGRPDQLVRGVDLIGTPLSMFSNITHAGDDPTVFTGMCGAESGSIPVTAISPTILVNKVETQLKSKTENTQPILSNPVAEAKPKGNLTDDQTIFRAMQDELDRNRAELVLPGNDKPFYLSYAVGTSDIFDITGVLGSIVASNQMPASTATARTLLGDYKTTSDSRFAGRGPMIDGMPLGADYDLIRRTLWSATDQIYKMALREKAGKEATLKSKPPSEDEAALDDLNPVPAVEKIATDKAQRFDMPALEALVAKLSAVFAGFDEILDSKVNASGFTMDIYKLTSEGVKLKVPMNVVSIMAKASVRNAEGNNISDTYTLVVPLVSDLPSEAELTRQVRKFAEGLIALANAPLIEEYYSGPILFEDAAVMNILNGTLLSSGQSLLAQRNPVGLGYGRSLYNRMGRKIIDNRLSVKNYSTLKEYDGKPLYGAYGIDAEGVVPPAEITLVEKGILKAFLNGSVPALGAPTSTGSSRFVLSNQAIAYTTAPGVLRVTAERTVSPEELKKSLLAAAVEEGLEYAYIVRKLAGNTSLVYKVNVADSTETQIRLGDMTPVTLANMKLIRDISDKVNVSNYVSRSGVMTSMIYPSGLILENMEIARPMPKPDKEPTLTPPAKRK